MSVGVLPTIDRLPEPLRRFMDRLTDEQKLLLVLKRELYAGDWAAMIQDLRHRLEGRPYVLRLAARIEDDLARIQAMRQLEHHYEVDLADFLAPIPDPDQESPT